MIHMLKTLIVNVLNRSKKSHPRIVRAVNRANT